MLDLSGDPLIYAAQCKLKDWGKSLSPREIQEEVDKAKTLGVQLAKYAILTTGLISTDSQLRVLQINQAHRASGLFEVEVLTWEIVCDLLREYPDLVTWLYGDVSQQLSTAVRDSLTVIISVHNESHALRDLFKNLKAEGLDAYPIILCDDGSTDGSFELMEQYCQGIRNVTCIRNRFNSRKVGAISRMVELVRTPFVLTLDADSILSELKHGALEDLIIQMNANAYSAACFTILPTARNWLGRLQRLDYLIFTDSVRRLLRVPVCLVGQGVLWRTECLSNVLGHHSGQFDGDDLENTVIALSQKMRIHWERNTLVVIGNPKRTVLGLIRQRGLSWDFGLFRVLFRKQALQLGGESGALYKNVLLMDFFGHPLRLLAVPLLFSFCWLRLAGAGFEPSMGTIYSQSVQVSLAYGSRLIVFTLILSIINSAICVKGRVLSMIKWSIFSVVYLASPFVYALYYRLIEATTPNPYDTLGSAMYWLAEGLVLTYLWWVFVAVFLLSVSLLAKGTVSSLPRNERIELIWAALLAPIYYFILLIVCKTVGICKYLSTFVFGRVAGL